MSIRPSVRLWHLFYNVPVIESSWKFQQLLPLTKDVHAKGQVRGLKVKVTEVKTKLPQFGRFWTVTPVGIHTWLRNDAQSLQWHRRGALLFFEVIREIPRPLWTNNCSLWPELGVSGLQLQFEYTNGYEMMHKAGCSIEKVPYCFSRSSVKFQGRTGPKKLSILIDLGVSGLSPQLEFTDGYEMIHTT